jgi:bacillithiol biosynthesis cysteine-adding enzyme BshC
MTGRLITPSKALGLSSLYLDYLSGRKPAADFLASDNPVAIAETIDRRDYRRDQLCSILIRQNRGFDVDQSALDSISRLKDPRAVCVFAGQQAGLFTGPLLVIVKALAIVKLAQEMEAELGRPVVPIFWIAGDDHDFDEIATTYLLNQQSELVELTYASGPAIELPVAEVRLENSDELTRLKTLMQQTLGKTDFTGEVYSVIDTSYAADETFVSAFGKMMARLTTGTGLAFFNPGDVDAKTLAVSFFERLVDSQDDVHRTLTLTNAALQSSGYHLQVERKENSALLFRHSGGRKPVHYDAGRFIVNTQSCSASELKAEVRQFPGQFSPDVMTRPLMQSTLFPVICQLGGPAEVAYLAQCRPLFKLFDLPTPIHRGRPSLTLLERRIEKLFDEYNLTYDDITGDIEQAVNRVMAATFPKDLESGYRSLIEDLSARWQRFADTSLAFDPSLEEFAKQTYGKIDFSLKNFEAKLFSAHKKKGKDIRERIHRVQHHLFPRRTLQERVLNISCYLARYGFGLPKQMLRQMSTDPTAHQLISLAEKADV